MCVWVPANKRTICDWCKDDVVTMKSIKETAVCVLLQFFFIITVTNLSCGIFTRYLGFLCLVASDKRKQPYCIPSYRTHAHACTPTHGFIHHHSVKYTSKTEHVYTPNCHRLLSTFAGVFSKDIYSALWVSDGIQYIVWVKSFSFSLSYPLLECIPLSKWQAL